MLYITPKQELKQFMAKIKLNGSALVEYELRTLVSQSRPGVKLPSENAVAAKYKVARMTVTKVFNSLAEAGLIERKRGSGSFVKGIRTVTFLVPAPDFMLNIKRYASSYEYFAGALRAAAELGMMLETLPVSCDNNYENIDFKQFDHITENTLTIVPGTWFVNCFKLLSERRARVVMLDTQSRCYGANQYMSNWLRLTGDRKKALKTFLHRFRELGCSRPAIVSPYLRTKNVPLNDVHTVYSLGEVAEGLIRIKLREECPSNSLLARSILRKTLHRYYRKYNFDALILDIANVSFGENVHEFCNLPQSVKICGIHNSAENLGVPYCTADAPHEQMGYDAVKVLLESTRSRGEILYDYTFKNFDLLN